MKIFVLDREDDWDYDEIVSVVVVALDEGDARARAEMHCDPAPDGLRSHGRRAPAGCWWRATTTYRYIGIASARLEGVVHEAVVHG